MSPDPYGEFFSPYLAMGNNPVSTVDPDGGKVMRSGTGAAFDVDYQGRERKVEPFDMVGGSGTREEKYGWSNGKLISLEDDPYSPYTLAEQLKSRVVGSGYAAGTGSVYQNSGVSQNTFNIYESKSSYKIIGTYTAYFDANDNLIGINGLYNAQGGGGGLFGDILTGTEKHFNGGLGTLGVAVQGYNNIGNDVKRAYAYKLSKMTGVKSGQIFQGAKGFANSTGKLVSKLGPVGTVLGGGVIVYEGLSGTWDAHTIVNGGLMLGAAAATIFAAPAVLTGIALYGVGDYFFDFSGGIDNTIGRNSGIWKP